MTELEREARAAAMEYVQGWKRARRVLSIGYDSQTVETLNAGIVAGYIAAAEPREKRIAELEEQVIQLENRLERLEALP